MPWVRFDDGFPIHRKVAPLDDATYRLMSEAIHWCSRNLTDGRIAVDELSVVSTRATKARAAKLVERNLWHPADFICSSDKCPEPGKDGWVIHDYLEYQFSKERVVADLAAKAERTRRWREKKSGDRKRDASGDASQDASRDGVSDASPSPSPPRREAGTGTVPEALPAAAGDGAPAGSENQDQSPPPRCRSCGNAFTSQYHRKVCRDEPIAIAEPPSNGRHALEEQTQLLPFLRAVPNQESA